MIVYGCLNTFLPILKMLDSFTPLYHPISRTSFRWIVVKKRQKIFKNRQNRQKIVKIIQNLGQKVEILRKFCHT